MDVATNNARTANRTAHPSELDDARLEESSLGSRLLLAAVLVAWAVLIPGEAPRLVTAPLTWRDVLPPEEGPYAATPAAASRASRGGAARPASGIA
jgi:hypothetical protein